MKTTDELAACVEEGIARLPLEMEPTGLYKPIRYTLTEGGKRLRPLLMLMAYNLYKEDTESILSQAMAIEMYHNFTLLHDDVMDRADMRRGKPTVHKVWNENTAILSGDTMLLLACQLMQKQSNPTKRAEVMDLFIKTALEIDEGQQYDVDFETRDDVTEEEYIEMIRLKTSVLLACALKIGAILGGATPQDADALYTFGEKTGLAFQLQDDYLDVYGDPKVFGKKIGGDILCNKKTYMLINALRMADAEARKELEAWLQKTDYNAEEKIQAVTEIYTRTGVKELCQKRMEAYHQEALTYLNKVTPDESLKTPLRTYVTKLMNRNK
jgi:geranylgeranyl diphosphate synthase type II